MSRGDTELHNTDFKGERMSVKKDTKLHVEKIRRYMSIHVKYQLLSNVNLTSQYVAINFFNVISALT